MNTLKGYRLWGWLLAVIMGLGSILLVGMGCTANHAYDGPRIPMRSQEGIVGGQTETSMPAVVALVDQWGGSFCSGTLVTPRIVATAAHCLEWGWNPNNEVYFGTVTPGGGTYIGITQAVSHPNFDPNTLNNDIAILHLASNAQPRPMGYRRNTITTATNGQNMFLVGFGVTSGWANDGGTKRSALSPQIDVDQDFVYYGGTSTNTCFGDSGGPAFGSDNGWWTLWGVTSWGDQNCNQFGANTRTDIHLNFIDGEVNSEHGTPDPCTANGWYNDGVCDPTCPIFDNDCNGNPTPQPTPTPTPVPTVQPTPNPTPTAEPTPTAPVAFQQLRTGDGPERAQIYALCGCSAGSDASPSSALLMLLALFGVWTRGGTRRVAR